VGNSGGVGGSGKHCDVMVDGQLRCSGLRVRLISDICVKCSRTPKRGSPSGCAIMLDRRVTPDRKSREMCVGSVVVHHFDLMDI
jgi:hypothetical protein